MNFFDLDFSLRLIIEYFFQHMLMFFQYCKPFKTMSLVLCKRYLLCCLVSWCHPSLLKDFVIPVIE